MILGKWRTLPGNTNIAEQKARLNKIFELVPGRFEFGKSMNNVTYYVVGDADYMGKIIPIGVADWYRVWSINQFAGSYNNGIWPIVLLDKDVKALSPDQLQDNIMELLRVIHSQRYTMMIEIAATAAAAYRRSQGKMNECKLL